MSGVLLSFVLCGGGTNEQRGRLLSRRVDSADRGERIFLLQPTVL